MTQTLAPTIETIEALAQSTIERLPEQFRAWLGTVVLRVIDFPDDDMCEEMDLETPFDLLGLYNGEPVGEKTGTQTGPDVVFLFRRPMLDFWAESGDPLEAIVAHVLVHEVGHHFGLSDEDMEQIEADL